MCRGLTQRSLPERYRDLNFLWPPPASCGPAVHTDLTRITAPELTGTSRPAERSQLARIAAQLTIYCLNGAGGYLNAPGTAGHLVLPSGRPGAQSLRSNPGLSKGLRRARDEHGGDLLLLLPLLPYLLLLLLLLPC